MTATTATVETLTAQVRVLAVGNRQVTLSIAKQLDFVPAEDIEPFGRINATWRSFTGRSSVTVIGRVRDSGVLALSGMHPPPDYGIYQTDFEFAEDIEPAEREAQATRCSEWRSLPLIVLAGLQ